MADEEEMIEEMVEGALYREVMSIIPRLPLDKSADTSSRIPISNINKRQILGVELSPRGSSLPEIW